MESIFSPLITSKTRIKILMRFFLNPDNFTYLREISEDLSTSPSQVKQELDQLKQANLLVSHKKGRQILFGANKNHPIFNELHSMVKKSLGMDKILDSIIYRLGNLESAILIDDYAEGRDTGVIDLVLVGDINKKNLSDLTTKTERYINRKLRILILSRKEYEENKSFLNKKTQYMLWKNC